MDWRGDEEEAFQLVRCTPEMQRGSPPARERVVRELIQRAKVEGRRETEDDQRFADIFRPLVQAINVDLSSIQRRNELLISAMERVKRLRKVVEAAKCADCLRKTEKRNTYFKALWELRPGDLQECFHE